MYRQLRPLLFLLPPEVAHDLCMKMVNFLPGFCFNQRITGKPLKCMGLNFANSIGLAAGLDKNADYVMGLQKLGFGFIEVGTVTPQPQSGNTKPRLFRLIEQEALINRMGFNNKGVDYLIRRLETCSRQVNIGINIGKNKQTPLEQASNDYLHCMNQVYAHADYISVNISSPNTPELRKLQAGTYLHQLLEAIAEKRKQLEDKYGYTRPVLIKVSPDEDAEQLKILTSTVLHFGMSGIIATNTTARRPQLSDINLAKEQGGLSGAPLRQYATEAIQIIRTVAGRDITIIAVGGIDSVQALMEKKQAGADLFQLYTGLIYHGPSLIRKLVLSLN